MKANALEVEPPVPRRVTFEGRGRSRLRRASGSSPAESLI